MGRRAKVRGRGGGDLSRSDPQIILGAQLGVKGTRSLEIAFYPLAFFFPMDQQL